MRVCVVWWIGITFLSTEETEGKRNRRGMVVHKSFLYMFMSQNRVLVFPVFK